MNRSDGQCWRLAEGGRIDRSRVLRFRFDGRSYAGYPGDTLASALLANGVRMVGRSFKYHRPRGVFSAGDEEPCALVDVGTGASRVPNCRASLVPLADGLVAASQRGWPTLGFDLGRVIDFTHALWPAGFYNKTFKWPSWAFWEPLLRRAAGFGRAPEAADPDRYEQVNTHCDLLICGGGPAGLAAARVAAGSGLRVVVADQGETAGGSLLWERAEIDGLPGHKWARMVSEQLRALDNVTLLERTTVVGVYDHNVTALVQRGGAGAWRECLWLVRPRRLLVAAGAIEQGLVFPDNDRPGIMQASAVRHYLNRQAVVPGREVVLFTNNDSAYQTVFDLAQNKLAVRSVIDVRGQVGADLQRRAAELGTEILPGARIAATRGSRGVRSVSVERLDGTPLGERPCDLLAVSGGWSARVHLLAHARGSLRFDAATQSFLPARLPAGLAVVGSANGTQGLQRTLEEAARTAQAICSRLERPAPACPLPRVTAGPVEAGPVAALPLRTARRRQWIDLAHDVTVDDAELAVREGFVAVEHFKRYTTTGMALDQGKTGNLNAFHVLGGLTGRATGEVGVTTFRPPYVPVTLGVLAGRRRGDFYAPRRILPAHRVHQRLGARFEDYGWQRPDCYPHPGESLTDAIRREVRTVRNGVGVFDNSPIGKLEVRGPDAATFLGRVYVNRVDNLPPGRARYGLMLNENGVIHDDGVFVRWAEDRFTLHTTSAGATRVCALLEEWLQCEWPQLQVLVDDLTSQWANFTVAGPRSRELLQTLGTDIDLAPATLPHMAAVSGRVAGFPVRVVRVSFSGELSYELNVAAGHAEHLLERLLEAGAPLGVAPYGIESLMVLRLEKGYLHVGSDTDGSSTPDDVGWGPVARARAGDFIGKRSLQRSGNLDPDRRQFVGLEPLQPDRPLRPGAHLLTGPEAHPPGDSQGWLTSACWSPTLERWIALGVLRGGRSRLGEVLTACDEEIRSPVRVVSPVFYDPANERLKM